MQLTQNIDDVLYIYLNEKYTILKEDELKIEKASLLFSQDNVEKTTHIKHILKLAFKFLLNRKFLECETTLNRFSDKLENTFIINDFEILVKKFKSDENKLFNINDHKLILLSIFENYSEDLKIKNNSGFSIPLCFCKQLIRAISDCFYSYYQLHYSLKQKISTDISKKNTINVIDNILF